MIPLSQGLLYHVAEPDPHVARCPGEQPARDPLLLLRREDLGEEGALFLLRAEGHGRGPGHVGPFGGQVAGSWGITRSHEPPLVAT